MCDLVALKVDSLWMIVCEHIAANVAPESSKRIRTGAGIIITEQVRGACDYRSSLSVCIIWFYVVLENITRWLSLALIATYSSIDCAAWVDHVLCGCII